MSIPTQPGQYPSGPPAPPESAVTAAQPRQRRSPLIIGLSITCAVFLLSTVALAGTTTWLFLARSSSTAPTATPVPSPESTTGPGNEAQTVHDLEVTTYSDLEFGDYAMSDTDADGFTILVAPVAWNDADRSIAVYFDITAYAADGRIVSRTPTNFYVLPGQDAMFYGILRGDLSDAIRIAVEQTDATVEAPVMTGGITMDRAESGDSGYAGGSFTSSLSAVPDYATVYIAGFVDDEIFGVCMDYPDIPAAGGTFVSTCMLTPVSKDEQTFEEDFPEDTEFRGYLELDIPL